MGLFLAPVPPWPCGPIPSLTSPERVPHRPSLVTTRSLGQMLLPIFEVSLASSGHRGRNDARGRPAGRARGLTRTSGQHVSAPPRDGRCTSPSAPCCPNWNAVPTARRPAAPKALPIVDHEKERLRPDPQFASSPLARVNAGRGHRRGLDGPTMPKPPQKYPALLPSCECCLPARPGRHGEAGESFL